MSPDQTPPSPSATPTFPPPTPPPPPPPPRNVARPRGLQALILAAGVVVAISLLAALLIANARDRRTTSEIRKHTDLIMLDLADEMDRAAVAMQAFNADGGLDLSGLEDRAALDRRIDLAAKAQAAAEHVLAFGNGAPDRLGDTLRDHPANRIAQAKEQLPQRMKWLRGRHIFETHARAYAAAIAQLEFLKQHAGHWQVDPTGLRVNWDSQDLQSHAEKLQAEVTAAGAAQAALASPTSTSMPSTP